jgi:hypothetical protein
MQIEVSWDRDSAVHHQARAAVGKVLDDTIKNAGASIEEDFRADERAPPMSFSAVHKMPCLCHAMPCHRTQGIVKAEYTIRQLQTFHVAMAAYF